MAFVRVRTCPAAARNVAFVGDHGEAREEFLLQPRQELPGDGGWHDDLDLDVGELLDVRRAVALGAAAFDGEQGVAVRADFVRAGP